MTGDLEMDFKVDVRWGYYFGVGRGWGFGHSAAGDAK